jgi:hypothetical protein
MPYPGQVFEDPMYDEDGNLVDEDFDPQEIAEEIAEYDPFQTVNS